jgi:hypothetical protein
LPEARSQIRLVPDEPQLREADDLGRRKRAIDARLVDPAMGDQLHDVADRVMEVARERAPEVELEDDLAALSVREELCPLADPPDGLGEAVSRQEQCEVVERPARAGAEAKPCLAEVDAEFFLVELLEAEPQT